VAAGLELGRRRQAPHGRGRGRHCWLERASL
jgi:hypothetical protein